MSQCRMPERGMSDLSAKALTEDAEGCSRLRAVIATDPGYAVRAQEALADRDAVLATHASRDAGPACQSVNAAAAAPARRNPTVPEIPAASAASAVLALAFGVQNLSSLTVQVPTP